ncbi:MAG: PAS domain S-box protein, partial [Deltaproteobacteria bacterium]|nr:PAS domain S-box protein [Deltaproteobacteria bacterium]
MAFHDICPVTGLSVIQKPEWTNVRFGKDYSITLSILGGNILRVQPCGYVDLKTQVDVLKFTEDVAETAIFGGQPYIRIEDWLNFEGVSLGGRKYYIDTMSQRKRIMGIIFCHVSYRFRMSIKLGKHLHVVRFPVHIAEDYAKAVALALDIRSKKTPAEDSSASPLKCRENATLHSFPSNDASVCPFSSLPITKKPEWTDIPIDTHYTVTFSLIGEAMLLTIPNGRITDAGTRRLLEAREKVLTDAELKGKRYAEIRDHRMITGRPSKTARMLLTNVLLDETREGTLCGFWVFNSPLIIRWMFNVGTKLYESSVPVGAVKGYREAVSHALGALAQGKVFVGEKQYNRTQRDAWAIELDDYGVRFELIGNDTLYSVAHGILKEDYVPVFFTLCEKVLNESGLMENGYYYRIVNWRHLEKTTWKARKLYMDSVKRLNQKIPCKYSVLFGLNGFMKTIINISKQLVPIPVNTAHDFEEAMAILEAERNHEYETGIVRRGIRQAESRLDSTIAEYCDDLLRFMGGINWDQEGIEGTEFDENHPFRPVFESMAIIKQDVDDLFRTQKEIEEALKGNERKYRDIFENVSDFIYVHDLDGYFTETNLVWKKELGFTEAYLADLNVKDLLPERYKDQFQNYLKRVKAEGTDEGLMCIMTKDGCERIMAYRNSLVQGSKGPIGIRGSARDITDQVSAQRALAQSEEKYRTILESIEDGYFEVDLSGNLTFFNDALCRIVGLSRNELMGISNREYMDEATARRVYKTYVNIYQTEQPVKGLEFTIRRNGIQKHVETSVSLIKDRKGKSVGFRGILRDVSERKLADDKIRQYSEHLEEMVESRTKALQKSEEKYRTILENIEDGYYEVDLSGNLTFFNDAVCRISGYSREELIGRNHRDYADEETISTLYAEYKKVYETGIPTRRFECKIKRKDNTTGFIEVSISLIKGAEGGPVGFRGIARDITERKELEREIVEKRKLAEEATRAKSEFLANMSHEIRTPLNGIVGMTELALDTRLDDNQQNIFRTILNETRSLQEIINDILDFSKIEAGKLDLEEIAFNLRVTIEDLSTAFAYRAEQKGLDFISFIAPNVPSQLMGDPARLRQILVNLIDNALKFTREGELYVKVELAEEKTDRLEVRFSVKDTGIGIPKARHGTIFESFTQADGSTTRKFGGTGLGTTISKHLAEMMGGKIGFESEEGQGSTFWFTAWFKRQTDMRKLPAAADIELQGVRVLVVDDNPTSRFVLAEYLKSWGCRPTEAADAAGAMTALKHAVSLDSDPFDLILTNVQMRGANGFELAKEIKRTEALKTTPIIVLTSTGRKGEGKTCREIGVHGYLTKPIRQDELHKTMVSVLGLSKKVETISPPQLVTTHSITDNERKDVQILLVEDYPTNQLVAMRHLTKAGFQVDLAEDGEQAVKAYKQKNYDLIFMDIQMPVMDGYDATREIRRIEKRHLGENGADPAASQAGPLPIIAMTAHALKGYREKCLDAGMNDYISKPIRRKELLDMVEKWIHRTKKTTGNALPVEVRHSEAPLEYARALSEFEGDEAFLMEAAQGFIQNVRSQIEMIRQAIFDGDAETVRKEAHSIKGGAANLAAEWLSEIALELENLGKATSLGKSR